MFGLIAVIGLLFAIPVFYFKFLPRKTKRQRELTSWWLFAIMILIVCSFATFSLMVNGGWVSSQQAVTLNSYKLHSMNGDMQLNGSFNGFFLFQSGKLDEEMTYNYWYAVSATGWKHAQLTDGDNVTVYEDATIDTAMLLNRQNQTVCGESPQWADWFIFGCAVFVYNPWWEFHVPPGTIHSDFSAN